MAIVNRGYGIGGAGVNIVSNGYGLDMWYLFRREVLRLTTYIRRTMRLSTRI